MTVLKNTIGSPPRSVCGNLDSFQSSVSQLPSRAGRILPYLLYRGRAAEHGTIFMSTLVSKKVFSTIPLLGILFLPLLPIPRYLAYNYSLSFVNS